MTQLAQNLCAAQTCIQIPLKSSSVASGEKGVKSSQLLLGGMVEVLQAVCKRKKTWEDMGHSAMMEGKVHGWAAGMLGQAELSGDVLLEIVPTPCVKNGNDS